MAKKVIRITEGDLHRIINESVRRIVSERRNMSSPKNSHRHLTSKRRSLQEGKLLSNQLFDNVGGFYKGFARVKLNGKIYKLDTNGQLYTLDSKPITLESINMNKKVIITEGQFAALQNMLLMEATIEDIQRKYS